MNGGIKYSIDLNIDVEEFKDYDKEEVLSFIELDIYETLKLLNKKVNSIKGKDDNGKIIKIGLKDFDSAFINNGLYITLLTGLNIKRGNSKMNKKLKKLYKITNKEKKNMPEKFYFDEGRVCNSKDYKKDDIKYSVQLINTDRNTNNYVVCLLAIFKHKSIPQLLSKQFKSKYGTEKYFNSLCNLVDCIYMDEEFIEYIKQNPTEYNVGEYKLGRYAWVMEDIEPIYPIPAKGQLNIWNFDGDYKLINKFRIR